MLDMKGDEKQKASNLKIAQVKTKQEHFGRFLGNKVFRLGAIKKNGMWALLAGLTDRWKGRWIDSLKRGCFGTFAKIKSITSSNGQLLHPCVCAVKTPNTVYTNNKKSRRRKFQRIPEIVKNVIRLLSSVSIHLPICVNYDREFSTNWHALRLVHAVGTVTHTIADSWHGDRFLTSILSRKKNNLTFCLIMHTPNNYPGLKQRKKSSVGHSRSLKGAFSSSPATQSTTPSQSTSPGTHLPSRHLYSFSSHFGELTDGVKSFFSEGWQASVSSLRSRQLGMPSHISFLPRQAPNGQRQESHLGAGIIGTKTEKENIAIQVHWKF